MKNKIRDISVALVFLAWIFGFMIFGMILPDKDVSYSERRKLKTFPEIKRETLLDGSFMSDFEKYSADQFPLRESFRKIKSAGEFYIFRQSDSNGVYMHNGYLSGLEKDLDEESLDYAAGRIRFVYEKFLKDRASAVYLSIVPDKNYFLKDTGVPTLDYDRLVSIMREKDDFAEYIDIFPYLELADYYKTDTHWRIEKIGPAAKALAEGMGTTLAGNYEVKEVSAPFYGVYSGQLALGSSDEKMYYITSPDIENATVYNAETGKNQGVYDFERADGQDPYEFYLSGPRSMMVIENENAETDKELIIIRDSFGSSLAPHLIEAYKKITLLDIRYLPAPLLNRFADFEGRDVLFIYSTLILNSSETLT